MPGLEEPIKHLAMLLLYLLLFPAAAYSLFVWVVRLVR